MSEIDLSPITRLSQDLKKATETLSPQEARYLVDAYYTIQDYRKAAANQVRALNESQEPHDVLNWYFEQAEVLESQVKRALGAWSDSRLLGKWCQSIIGIGPVISAGLIAHIDITKAPTVGHIWSFAGLDPRSEWKKGEKRPWNGALKTLCWKVGESFVKVSGNAKSLYGQLYVKRKEYEVEQNLTGKLCDQAKAKLEKYKIGKTTDAYLWYAGCLSLEAAQEIRSLGTDATPAKLKALAGEPGSGLRMLPPAHLHARAKRWAVKLFLSHYHAEAYYQHYGAKPPNPYPIEHMGHVHWIAPEK